MGNIYWNKQEIPIPSVGKVNHYNGQVSVYYRSKNTKVRRKVIGHATSDSTMHPNDNFKHLYPELWKEHYGEDVYEPFIVKAGLFCTTLGIGYKTNLYPIIQEVFGPQNGNAIMDYAMFSITDRSNVALLFNEEMQEQMLFSRKALDDSWLSDLFKNKISSNEIQLFRNKWLEQCAKNGMNKVWLCIDGSNNNCEVNNSELAEKGKAKSKKNVNIVSYIWAVDASSGKPVTWFENNGAMPDCKSLNEIIVSLKSSSISVEGVILDRAFASENVIDTLRNANLAFIIMLKSNTYSYTEMLKKYADIIRWKTQYVVNENGIFGICEKHKTFKDSKEDTYVSLFFDANNGASRSLHFLKKVMNVKKEIQKQIDENPYDVKIMACMKDYFILHKEDKKISGVEYNHILLQQAIDEKGFCAIASSENYTSERIYELYTLRDSSEKQFAIMKSQLGYDVTRVHNDNSIKSRLAVCFIASIIRTEIMLECKKLKLDTNVMIKKLNRIQLIRMADGRYHSVQNLSDTIKKFVGEFGIKESHLEHFARELNEQKDTSIVSQKRVIPLSGAEAQKTRKGGRKKKEKPDEENTQKRGRGRPKGSKNKNTVAVVSKEEKRKAGRPKGSKNKTKAEKEALRLQTKRGVGRPKGSKNKKTLQLQTRKPGRPKGSRNKTEAEKEALRLQSKRGVGRPKGSKNKRTLQLETRKPETTTDSLNQKGVEKEAPKEQLKRDIGITKDKKTKLTKHQMKS